MRVPQFSVDEFVDASSFNTAFGSVSGSISSAGTGAWAAPGLIAPESITVAFSGMTMNVGMASPVGIISSGGVTVRAHGTSTGADTTNYAVNFTSLIPGSGSITAYLVATVSTIQQNPFAIPGPPPGHPSFDPNFVPTVGYASTVYTMALSASSTAVDNISSFELARTTLSAGQSSITTIDPGHQVRAVPRIASSPLFVSTSSALTAAQVASHTVESTVAGLTTTLPSAGSCIGLFFRGFNTVVGNWTIACAAGDLIWGIVNPAASIVLPSLGSVTLYADVDTGWRVVGFNTHTNNIWTGTNEFTQSVTFDQNITVDGHATIVGSVTTTGAASDVISARDVNASRSVNAQGSISAVSDITSTGGNANIHGNVNANNVTASATVSGFNVYSQTNVHADGDLTCGINMSVGGTATVSGGVTGFQFSSTTGAIVGPGYALNLFNGNGWYFDAGTANIEALRYDGLNLGYFDGSGNLHVYGTVAYPSYSDIRLKYKVTSYERGLPDLMNVEPISFRWTGECGTLDDGKVHFGVSAQASRSYFPEAVSVTDGAPGTRLPNQLEFDKDALLMAAINAIKTLKAENDDLRARVTKIEAGGFI